MKEIIESDPTLNFLINESSIDWFNDFQVTLRFNALKIALYKYIDAKY